MLLKIKNRNIITDAVSVVPEKISSCGFIGVQIDFDVKRIATTTTTIRRIAKLPLTTKIHRV